MKIYNDETEDFIVLISFSSIELSPSFYYYVVFVFVVLFYIFNEIGIHVLPLKYV